MPDKYALIIGIENYPEESGQEKVKFAVNDAKAMAEYAQVAGFHLVGGKPLLDEDASYSEVIRVFDYMFHYVKQNTFVLLYYAGHGYFTEYGGYLIPFDYHQGKEINESSCISFDSINKRIRRKKPNQFVFFLDTCHSGFAGKQIDIRKASARDIVVTSETRKKISEEIEEMVQEQGEIENIGRVVFTSSGPDEKSTIIEEKKHGLFTHFLLSGLKRRGQKEKVNIEELISYVKEQVIKYALDHKLKQTPMAYTNIQGKLFLPSYKIKDEEDTIIVVPELVESINKVHQAIETENYDKAEKLLLIILEKDNLNFEANRLLEELEIKKESARIEKENEKRKHFEEWLHRGEGFLKVGEYKKAKECFENAGKIYAGSEMVQSYLKDIEIKQEIVKIDDIEVPSGDKVTILKGLFKSAGQLSSEKKYAQALNQYNKILKTYPGNKRALKEKKSMYEIWLKDYKEEQRYFEMLGLLEEVIFLDESIKESHNEFKNINNETLLSYAETYFKSRINQKLEVKKRELDKKEELIQRYENVLSDYEELAMEKEYNELNKVMERLKEEADPLKSSVEKYSELLECQLFGERYIEEAVETLVTAIKSGATDKYIQRAYSLILKMQECLFEEAMMMPDKTREDIRQKIERFEKISPKVSDSLNKNIDKELKRLKELSVPIVYFRSEYETLSVPDVNSMLQRYNFSCKKYNWNEEFCNPSGSFKNEYELGVINGDRIVIDHATGLMWHESGLSKEVTFRKSEKWIKRLNKRGYAGYHDWRFPTLEEGASLLDSRHSRHKNHLFIDPLFTIRHRQIWTGDMADSGSAWVINFSDGAVQRQHLNSHYKCCVMPVRSGELELKRDFLAIKKEYEKKIYVRSMLGLLIGLGLISLYLLIKSIIPIYSTLSKSDVINMVKKHNFFEKEWNEQGNFKNNFELKILNGIHVVIDHATGLMWEKYHSAVKFDFKGAKEHIKKRNKRGGGWAGFHDWRLPTLEEAASLMVNNPDKSGAFIENEFYPVLGSIWTGDNTDVSGYVWEIQILSGRFRAKSVDQENFILLVRYYD